MLQCLKNTRSRFHLTKVIHLLPEVNKELFNFFDLLEDDDVCKASPNPLLIGCVWDGSLTFAFPSIDLAAAAANKFLTNTTLLCATVLNAEAAASLACLSSSRISMRNELMHGFMCISIGCGRSTMVYLSAYSNQSLRRNAMCSCSRFECRQLCNLWQWYLRWA